MNFYHKFFPRLDDVTRRIKRDVKGARHAGMISVVTGVESLAQRYAPVRTSNLVNSGTSGVDEAGKTGFVSFGGERAPYPQFVHEGTGLYGPHRTKIKPTSKRALFWPGAEHPVKSVRGMHGNPFLTRAAADADIPALYAEGANNYLATQGGK